MNRQILKLRVECPNKSCHYKEELGHIEEHIRVCHKHARKCPYVILGCETEEAPKDMIKNHCSENTLIHSDILIKYILNLKRDFEESKEEIVSLKEDSYLKEVQMKQQDREIEILQNESNNTKLKMDEQQKEVDLLKEDVSKMEQEVEALREDLNERVLEILNLKEEAEKCKMELGEQKEAMELFKVKSEKNEIMLSAKFSSLWEIMMKYTFKADDNESLNANLTCLICKNLMIDSCQSSCGCQYCFKCVNEYLRDEEKYCPGKKLECQDEYLVMETSVFRSSRMNKQILKLRVECPNESCDYKEELGHMEEHIRVCHKQARKCPYVILGCETEETSKDMIKNHCSENTLIHSDILIKYILNLKRDFEESKEEIVLLKEDSYIKEVQMKQQDREIEILQNDSNNTKLKINEQQKEVDLLKEDIGKMEQEVEALRENLNEHLLEILNLKEEVETYKMELREQKEVMELFKVESEKNEMEVKELKKEIISLKKESKKAENMKQELDCFREKFNTESEKNKVEVEELKKEIISLKKESKKVENMKQELDSFREKSNKETENNKVEIEELKKEMTLLKTDSKKNVKNKEMISKKEGKKIDEKFEKVKNIAEWIKSPNIKVDFIWRIDGISQKIIQSLFSEPFYSNNYKLRLHYEYYPDYNSEYFDCYSYWCGFSIMRGDNDDRAEWPLRLSVTLSMMNQVSLRPQRSETLKYDTQRNKGGFERPKSEENDKIWTEISKNDHSLSVFEDSLIIYCVVTPP